MTSEAIFISSHDESCGIAYFTDQIISDVSSIIPCKVIPLDLSLTRSTTKVMRRLADIHIKNICNSVARNRHINIQIEWGLFGSIPEDISRRLKWLIASNPQSVVTLHTSNWIQPIPKLATIAKESIKMNFVGAYRLARERRNVGRILSAYHSVILEAKRYNVPIIVHTKRAKNQIRDLFNYENVHVHPLCFSPPTNELKQHGSKLLSSIKTSLGLSNESLSVGLFGFVSRYKGHEDAVRAIDLLPDKYHLFIFGKQHPQSIRADGGVDSYISDLMSLIGDLGLHHRVHFLGELPAEDFAAMISAVDIAWLPYREVGQEGSAVAAQCIAGAKRIVFSASYAFDEMLKLEEKKYVVRADIGNYNNLANITELAMKDEKFMNDYSVGEYSAQTQRDMYVKLMGYFDVK